MRIYKLTIISIGVDVQYSYIRAQNQTEHSYLLQQRCLCANWFCFRRRWFVLRLRIDSGHGYFPYFGIMRNTDGKSVGKRDIEHLCGGALPTRRNQTFDTYTQLLCARYCDHAIGWHELWFIGFIRLNVGRRWRPIIEKNRTYWNNDKNYLASAICFKKVIKKTERSEQPPYLYSEILNPCIVTVTP